MSFLSDASLQELTTEEMAGDDSIIFPDILNTKLALAGLTLLKKFSLNNMVSEELSYRTFEIFSKLPIENKEFCDSLWVRPPCRWEIFKLPVNASEHSSVPHSEIEVILDIAHNPAAVSALVRKVVRNYTGRRVR